MQYSHLNKYLHNYFKECLVLTYDDMYSPTTLDLYLGYMIKSCENAKV